MYPQWSASPGLSCAACRSVVPALNDEDALCPLCWAQANGSDTDLALGQAIAVEGLHYLDHSPQRVADCVQRLRTLSEHAAGPAVMGVLADAARDLEDLSAQSFPPEA